MTTIRDIVGRLEHLNKKTILYQGLKLHLAMMIDCIDKKWPRPSQLRAFFSGNNSPRKWLLSYSHAGSPDAFTRGIARCRPRAPDVARRPAVPNSLLSLKFTRERPRAVFCPV